MVERGSQGAMDPAGEPPPALLSLVENHPHHALLLWGERLRCVALSRPLRRHFAKERSHTPAQTGAYLEAAFHEAARRVLTTGAGEIATLRLGVPVEGVQLCPAGLGGVMVLIPDLPEVMTTPKALRETATLRGILDALPLPLLLLFGPRGEERLINAAARSLFGVSDREDLLAEPLHALEARLNKCRGDGSLLPEDARPLRRALRDGETILGVEISFSPYSADTPIAEGGGANERRVFLESAAPIMGQAGDLLGAVAVFQEITEQKKLDHHKDQFLALAGHELRAPLTVLRTQTQLISRWLDELPVDQIRQVAEGIDQQAERLSQLVDDLLDVGRLATGTVELRPQAIDLSELAREVAARAHRASSDHVFDVRTGASTFVLGDAVRVEQVVSNLLDNAQRSAPPGTTISVRVSHSGRHALMSVTDQGPKVLPRDRERVFERFHGSEPGTRGERVGLGLRLWMSRKLVELMGGRIWVESEGEGTTFTFQLPLR